MTEQLEPGRELDALVHEILGHEVWWSSGDWVAGEFSFDITPGSHHTEKRVDEEQEPVAIQYCTCDTYDEDDPNYNEYKPHGHYWTCLQAIPRYSTNIAAAWQVAEKMREDGYVVSIVMAGDYRAVLITKQSTKDHSGKTTKPMPHAICLAALETVSA